MTSLVDKISKPMADWYQSSTIREFMQWWTTELKTFVPNTYRQQLFQKSELIYIDRKNADEIELWCARENELKAMELSDDLSDDQWWHQVNHYMGQIDLQCELICLLPQDQALFRNITLPSTAMNELNSVLSYELDKYLPYSAKDVVFAYQKAKVAEGSERVQIMLVAVKKKYIDDLIKDISSKGVKLTAIDVNIGKKDVPKMLGVNLLDKSQRQKKDWSKFNLNAGLMVVLVLSLSFVMFNSIENKKDKIDTLETQVDELRKQARNAKTLEVKLNESIIAANFLEDRKSNSPNIMLMLRELTSNIPKDTYLTRIMINEERLELVGQSDNANALVPILNKSEQWYAPETVGQIVPGPKKEKFTIKAKLKPEELEVSDES
ncbi:MAG: pilus assembly protein PilM [Proteobacteria bacterium]|nr:pilus assembly protein PilM [Pseudomonadota bacterium]